MFTLGQIILFMIAAAVAGYVAGARRSREQAKQEKVNELIRDGYLAWHDNGPTGLELIHHPSNKQY